MRLNRLCVWLSLALCLPLGAADAPSDGPKDDKAQKTYQQALDDLHHHKKSFALDNFKKADKQDGGHCAACQRQMIKYGIELGDWKTAELAGDEMVAEAADDRARYMAHYQLGVVYLREGQRKHKDEYFTRAHEEAVKALPENVKFAEAALLDGQALAYLHQDAAAKARFEEYLKLKPEGDASRQRVQRYVENPDLARARMAPPFSVTTLDGKVVSMDELTGKVVLIDFWATWCGPCRESVPHIREVAKDFQGQPLVILSVSLDKDQTKWKEFIAKNGMTWAQYYDGGFTGPMSTMFNVQAIPHTFTIDADGVLQEERIGDSSIEGKIKKLVAHAQELQASSAPAK